MATSSAKTVDEYLAELPAERRAVISAVRDVVRKNLQKGFTESMAFGLIGYAVPLARYPETYNGQPLCYAGLAAQKHHFALYLMDAYQDPRRAAALEAAFKRAGKKLDMGKSCIRFKSLDDLPLEDIGKFIAGHSVDSFIKQHETARGAR